jgi:hypothetical protein
MRAQYDIERAKLDVQKGDTSRGSSSSRRSWPLADAEAAAARARGAIKSDKTAAEADIKARQRKREKAIFDLERAQRGLAEPRGEGAGGRHGEHPAQLPRSATCSAAQQEFRAGDRAWPGASILELPDLSSIHLEARLDESDRGRLNPGQDATVRIEAVPGKDFKARIDNISLLARVDLLVGVAAAEELRPASRAARGRFADPSGHDGRGADCDRPRARRHARARRGHLPADGSPIVYRLDGPSSWSSACRYRGAGGSRRSSPRARPATASPRRPEPGSDQERTMTRRIAWTAALALVVLVLGTALAMAVPKLPDRVNAIPTARVDQGER